MASQHLGKVSKRLDTAVGCAPEPVLEVLGRPGFALVVPQSAEQLLEKVGFHCFEIHFEQISQRSPLTIAEVPGILQPDAAGAFVGLIVGFGKDLGFYSPHVIDWFHQMPDDMEFVENDQRFPAMFMDDVDVVLPHVTIDALNGDGALSANLACPVVDLPLETYLPVFHLQCEASNHSKALNSLENSTAIPIRFPSTLRMTTSPIMLILPS